MPRRKDPRLRLVRTWVGYDRSATTGGRYQPRKGGWETRDGRFMLIWLASKYGWLKGHPNGALELTDRDARAGDGPVTTHHYGMREALAEIARRYDRAGVTVTVRGNYSSAVKAAAAAGRAPKSVSESWRSRRGHGGVVAGTARSSAGGAVEASGGGSKGLTRDGGGAGGDDET